MELDPSTGRCMLAALRLRPADHRRRRLTIRDNTLPRIPGDGIQSGTTQHLIEGNLFEDITAFVDPTEHSDSIQFYRGSDHLTLRSNSFRRTRGPLIGDPDGRRRSATS